MTSPRSRQLAIASLAIVGISGWIVAWKMRQERDELGSSLQRPAIRSIAQPTSAKSPPPSLDTAPGMVKLIQDKRTAAFVESLPGIITAARDGTPNERYVQAAHDVLKDNNWERRTLNFGILMENLRPEDAPAIQAAFAALKRQGRPWIGPHRPLKTSMQKCRNPHGF